MKSQKPPYPGGTRRGVAPTPIRGEILIMQGFGGGSPHYYVCQDRGLPT
jgi:hypothetical protein